MKEFYRSWEEIGMTYRSWEAVGIVTPDRGNDLRGVDLSRKN